MAEDPQCFAVREKTTLTRPSLGLAAARNAFSVSLRTKKGPKKSAVPRNTTLSGSGSCKECLPCCFHIQTGPPTKARCLKIRPSVAFAPAGNAFPISRQVSKERLLGVSPGQKKSLCAVVGTKKPSRPLQAPFKPLHLEAPLEAPLKVSTCKPPSSRLRAPFKPPSSPFVLSEAFMMVRPLEAPLKPL